MNLEKFKTKKAKSHDLALILFNPKVTTTRVKLFFVLPNDTFE